MRRITAVVAYVGLTAAVCSTLASTSYAETERSLEPGLRLSAPFPLAWVNAPSGLVSPLLAREIAGLTHKGIPYERATRAITVQGDVAKAHLVERLESAMGRAFGGVWFDPSAALMHVGVTSRQSRQVADRVVAREGLQADVTTTQVGSSWAQLLALKERWNRRLMRFIVREEAETALSADQNAVSLTLSSSVPRGERKTIKSEAASSHTNVLVAVSSHPRIGTAPQAETKCTLFSENKANCEPPLTAGVKIVSATKALCTAGPMGITSPTSFETWVLTAGHCIKDSGGLNVKWYAVNPGVTPLVETEVGPASKETFSDSGDYGAILIHRGPGFLWALGGNTPVFAVTAEWKKTEEKSYPVSGQREPMQHNTDCHEGQSSGEACGEVTATGVTLTSKGVTILGLVEDKLNAGEPETKEGDSGGPWMFIGKGNEATMEGTHVGKLETGTKNPIFEPIHTALTGLGLELLTTSNETR